MVVIACWLRACSYGIRAAYLVGAYTPPMGGVAFAFLNGGVLAVAYAGKKCFDILPKNCP